MKSEEDIMIFRALKYSFIFTVTMFIMFLLSFMLIFHTFFVVDKTDAVQTGDGYDKFSGSIDIDEGYVYMGATTTPTLGQHAEHGVIYPKSDCKLYYIYDKTGETEKEIALLDDGTLLLTNLGSDESYVTNLHATTANIDTIYGTFGSFTTMEADTANVTTLNNTILNVSEIRTADFQGYEKSSDPSNPIEGHYKIWMSNGTGSGDDGDIMVKITAGGTVKTVTLVDFSAF